jgi:hypothetical protein
MRLPATLRDQARRERSPNRLTRAFLVLMGIDAASETVDFDSRGEFCEAKTGGGEI